MTIVVPGGGVLDFSSLTIEDIPGSGVRQLLTIENNASQTLNFVDNTGHEELTGANTFAAGAQHGNYRLAIAAGDVSSPMGGLLVAIAGGGASIGTFNVFQTEDQNHLPIFWVGTRVGSAAGYYASLGTYADQAHQIGYYGDTGGGGGTHGYSFLNKWGTTLFNVGAEPHFYGNGLQIQQLTPPPFTLQANTTSNRVWQLTPGASPYTITANSLTTASIAAAATPSQVQSALTAAGILGCTVSGTGLAATGTPYAIVAPSTLGTFTTTATSITETTLDTSGSTTYYYVVTAINLNGNETVASTSSNIVPSVSNPANHVIIQQNWGMGYAKIYRGTSGAGPFNLIAYLNPNAPVSFAGVGVGFDLIDSGLPSQGSTPPTAPTPPGLFIQGWAGEPVTNNKLVIQNNAGTNVISMKINGAATFVNTVTAGSFALFSGNALIGQQAAYNAVTSNYNSGSMAASTWTAAAAGSGTAPVITMPSDGLTYDVEFQCSAITTNVTGAVTVGIGTSTSNILQSVQVQGASAVGYPIKVKLKNLTASGQVLSVYVKSAGTSATVTFDAANTPLTTFGPSDIGAIRTA